MSALPRYRIRCRATTKCISCFACVKGCTKKAREVKENGMYSKLVEMLETNLRYVEKEAEIFLLK